MAGPLRGKVTFSSDLRGVEFLNGVTVPRQVTVSLAGPLGEPDAAALFEVRDGQPMCVEFIVKAKPDGRGVRGSDMSGVNLSKLAETAFLSYAAPTGGGSLGGGSPEETRFLRKGIEAAVYPTGRGATAAELQEVARIYRAHPSAPTAAVEKLLRYKSRRTACRRVREARDAGLLEARADRG